MEQQLTDELVETAVKKAFDEFSKVGEAYGKGYLTPDDFQQYMLRSFNRVGFFDQNHIELRLNEENYAQFAHEFREYRNGIRLIDPRHLPWLYYSGGDRREATANDQRAFFHMMEAFHLAPAYFEPLPKSITAAHITAVHQYTGAGVYGTDFNCIDDGGLLTDANPVGKEFHLKNDLGLEAVVTIKEDRRHGSRSGLDFDEIVYPTGKGIAAALAEFLAEGNIEGYTAKNRTCNPEILIRLGDHGKRIDWLAYWMDSNDHRACREFPLWQEYFQWREKKGIERENMLSRLFDEFLPNSGKASGKPGA